MEVLPHLELSRDLTQSLKPGKCRGEPSISRLAGQVLRPTELCRQETRGEICSRRCTRVGTSPAPTWGLHKSLGCRASVAYRELFGNTPESTGKCLPCKDMPPHDNLNSSAKEQILPPYRNCSSQLDSSKLNGCGCKLDTSSLSFPLLLCLAHPARAAPTRTPHPPPRTFLAGPAGTAPHAQVASAGKHRPPGAIFLESQRASGRALLTCVFFIRKGCAVIQPRQRCGDSV